MRLILELFLKGKLQKNNHAILVWILYTPFQLFQKCLSYQLSKNWLTWLPLSTFKKIWIEMRLKSADTLEDRKKWRQKVFGKVPIDISKISVKLLSNYWFYNCLLMHTIGKVKFLSKNSILTKPQHFHKFFTQIFLTIFLVKSKLSTAKKSKTTSFSQVFHPKKNRQFSREIKVEFLDKKMKISNSVRSY